MDLRPHRLKLGLRLKVLRIDGKRIPVGYSGAGQVPPALHYHPQVKPVVRVLWHKPYGRFQRALCLRVEALLAVSNSQQGQRIRILVVRKHGSSEDLGRFVQVPVLEGLSALLAEGQAGCLHGFRFASDRWQTGFLATPW